MTLEELNALPASEAARAFSECCGSTRWAAAMAEGRPFAGVAQLHALAEKAWWALSSPDWLEAFSHHPRIGERAQGWANQEQAGTQGASQKIRDELVKWNTEYEAKFGFVFLICATGKTAGEMLDSMAERINNEPKFELVMAAGEQAKITHLRLIKMIEHTTPAARPQTPDGASP